MEKKTAIRTENLTKFFGKTRALNNFNIEISYGKIFGFLGPNGAGKTTTIRILSGILKPTSGKAYVGGYDVLKEKKRIKKICGLCTETPGIYNKLTANEYLEFMGELYDLSKDIIQSRVNYLLDHFDLADKSNMLLENFSAGMKQKVNLISSLIHDPKIIFLDEPTSNLDPASTSIVKELLTSFTKKKDRTVFLSTHLLDIAEELCDEIAIIDKGEIKYKMNSKFESKKELEEKYIDIIGKSDKSIDFPWIK